MSEVKLPTAEDLERRATSAVQARFAGARVARVAPLLGGTSSLTYQAELTGAGAERRVVIKVAPPGLPPTRNRDVLRQARIFEVLARAPGVAVPEVFGVDAGAPLEVPPLFVMSLVQGESYEPCLTALEPSASRAELETRFVAAARMLAALHAVAPTDPRIASEAPQNLPAELARWAKAFGSVEDDLRANEAEVHARLVAAMPAESPARILHGDYRLGNMQCEGNRIGALIDWEIWSLGDPRLDLAWFLWNSNPQHPSCTRANPEAPSNGALIAEYEGASGAPITDLPWFGALVRYKQAAASALIAKNMRKLAKPGVDASLVVSLIPRLLHASQETLGE